MREPKKYDLFISYRRDGGEHLAKNLRDALTERGYHVFFDLESLRTGKFNEKLFEVIKNCERFLLVLTPHALDRCINEEDWVRKEIECALKNDIPVVPILTRNFTFPETLPESMNDVRFYHGPAASTEYFDAFLHKLEEFLPEIDHTEEEERKRQEEIRRLEELRRQEELKQQEEQKKQEELRRQEARKKKRRLLAACFLLLAVALSVGGVLLNRHLSTFPHNQKQRSIVSEAIGYLVLNMTHVDVAQKAYVDALHDCRDYLSNPERFSRSNVDLRMKHALTAIAEARSAIKQLDLQLNDRLRDTPLGDREISAQPDGLYNMLDTMRDVLTHLNDFLIDDVWLLNTSKIAHIDIALEITETDNDLLFYLLNETLLPVDSSALAELKTKQLPLMTSIYDGQTFTSDADELEGLINRAYTRQDELIVKLDNSIGVEQYAKDFVIICDQIYAQHKPLRSDDPDTLWEKALRFTACGMYKEAAECYDMYGDADGSALGNYLSLVAQLFVLEVGNTGIDGGCIVAGYEEGKPNQPLEIGDIVYAVNGVRFYTFNEYVAEKAKHAQHTLSVIRFTGEGYELLEVTLDPMAGGLSLYSLNEDLPQ